MPAKKKWVAQVLWDESGSFFSKFPWTLNGAFGFGGAGAAEYSIAGHEVASAGGSKLALLSTGEI